MIAQHIVELENRLAYPDQLPVSQPVTSVTSASSALPRTSGRRLTGIRLTCQVHVVTGPL